MTTDTAVAGTETVIVDAAAAEIAAVVTGAEAAIEAAVGIVGEPADLVAESAGGRRECATAAHLPQDDGLDTARAPCTERRAPSGSL